MGHAELLRRNKSFRLLFLATLGSLVGTWLATIALTVEIYDRTHSGGWVSALLIAVFLPTVIVGVAVGPLLDRLSRRSLMIASDLLRAGVFVALPFVDRPVWIVALAGLSGLGNAVYRPTVNAAMPNLLEEDELEKGNAIFMTVENMAWAVGPLIGGAIVATSGTQAAYWINAVSFVLSAALIRAIPGARLQSEVSVSRGHWRDIVDGLALAKRSPAVQVVVAAWSVTMLGVACINVGEVVIAKSSFNAGDFGFGLLFGAGGVGLAIGSFAGGMLAERRPIGDALRPGDHHRRARLRDRRRRSERLARRACGRDRRHRERRVGDVQRAPDPARRSRLVPRSRLHDHDERHVRDPRAGDGHRRSGDDGAGRPLDLGDRRRLLPALRPRCDRALAAPPRLGPGDGGGGGGRREQPRALPLSRRRRTRNGTPADG